MSEFRRNQSVAALLADFGYTQVSCGSHPLDLMAGDEPEEAYLTITDEAVSQELFVHGTYVDLWIGPPQDTVYVMPYRARGLSELVKLRRISGVSKRMGSYIIWGIGEFGGMFFLRVTTALRMDSPDSFTIQAETEENATWYTVEAFRRLWPTELLIRTR